MDLISLSRLGGRHLVTLHLLLDSRSVTRSAERLCTTPSSVSKTLNQLRELLGDQLLYRQGNQLLPTPFAERIGPGLRRLLGELNGLTGQEGFAPASWQGELTLAMRESSMIWPMGPVLGKLMQEVPGLVPVIRNKEEQGLAALAAGKLDFVILPHDQSQPGPGQPGLVWETLREDRLVCLLRDDHPALAGSWDLDAYLSWRHIAIRDNELADPFFEQSLAQLQVRGRSPPPCRILAAPRPCCARAISSSPPSRAGPIRPRPRGWRAAPSPSITAPSPTAWCGMAPWGAIPPCAGSASGSCSWPGRWAPPDEARQPGDQGFLV